ncbi:DgyrCDS14191 [Dimorphilus gyrociliatus]|uniref:Phosphoinositide phospholipase C n=1 Tax=Dimorphilus gyrociliatus TaxID=2664684 RepID=A0A7I8WCV9_9ANNE|nr:DgyrCDS14191 [Dimorphilus gyrociliatus]
MADDSDAASRGKTSSTEDVSNSDSKDRNSDGNYLHVDSSDIAQTISRTRRSSLIKDPNKRAMKKKTVSFSSMPNERSVTNAPDCLKRMQEGTHLIKVRANSRHYNRIFQLDSKMQEICWRPSTKKPSKAKILVKDIKEIRVGKNTANYGESCSFTIVYGENFETMDLAASTPDEACIWVTGLTCLINGKPEEVVDDRQQMRDEWLQEVFDTNAEEGHLDADVVMRIVQDLNSSLPDGKVKLKLKEYLNKKNGSSGGRISSKEYSNNADSLTVDDLMLFLEAEQGIAHVTKEQCLEIINKYEPTKEGRRLGRLGIDGFTAHLLSNDCSLLVEEERRVCQDMTQPLSHYFISTSHNTYLLEDQLRGPSSVDGYARALRKGCRCLEMHCWDGVEGEPIIFHGHTLTPKISFSEVIKKINELAFEKSEYPLILHIENHCSIGQQKLMASTITDVFGSKLYTNSTDNLTKMPSPEELRGKILIQTKKLPDGSEENDFVTDEEEFHDQSSSDRSKRSKRESAKKRLLAKELSDLVSISRTVRFYDFETSNAKQQWYEVCSMSESSALKLSNHSADHFVNHNKKFLTRVFPNGSRIDSSNYNPQDMWNSGCQLVALNFQTTGTMMDLNDGKFLQNGGCGYVLKPGIMREQLAYFNANAKDATAGIAPKILRLRIISGQYLPKPSKTLAKGNVIDPYVQVEVFGIPADCAERNTKTVPQTDNPVFDEIFEFQINLPEMALVRFTVLDDESIGDEFIGQYTIPFLCMRTGYRHIKLLSHAGEELPNSTLFVHVHITNHSRYCSKRRSRKKKDYTTVKHIGVKTIDDAFKAAVNPMKEATDLRDNVQFALVVLREQCGLSPTASIKQCVRILSRTMTSCNATPPPSPALTEDSTPTIVSPSPSAVSLALVIKDDFPGFETQGNLPDILKKRLSAFENLINHCKQLMANCERIRNSIIQVKLRDMECHEQLRNTLEQHNLKGKKLNKAADNIVWNNRVLQGQVDLIDQSKDNCAEYIQQIQDSASSIGLTKLNNVSPVINGAGPDNNQLPLPPS